MASTVYYRIMPNDMFPEFGDFDNFNFGEGVDVYECLQNAYTHLVAQKLPNCLDWCGSELLIELDENNNISEKDEIELADFDFERIVEEAWHELFEASDEEILEMARM